MPRGLRIGRVFGVDVHVDPGLLLLFGLIAVDLAIGLFPRWHPDWGPALRWLTAIGAGVLFVLSVFVHELSHALVAKAFGLPVRRIVLFLFGGVANIEKEPGTPAAELLTAFVGPATSLLVGVVSLLLASTATWATPVDQADPMAAFATLGPAGTLLAWLGPVNLAIGLFNLIPGFPLDGGRVLRAIVWALTGDLRLATRVAATGGQLVGVVMIVAGLASAIGLRVPLLGAGGLVQGLWFALIGWFLYAAATAYTRTHEVRELLDDVPVMKLMRPPGATVSPDMTVDELVEDYLLRAEQRAFPVVDNGRLVGMVCLEDVREVPRQARYRIRVGDIMTRREDLAVLPTDAVGADALDAMVRRDVAQVPIVHGGRLIGVVRRADVMRWLEVRQAPA